jgi:protein-disulfide isomerase
MSKSSAIVAMIIIGVAGFFLGRMTASPPEEEVLPPPEGPPPELYRIPLGMSPWKGERFALVTIVEFTDFECPFCSRVLPTLEKILEEYEGKVKIVFKNNPLPFHRHAELAHEAAMAAHAQGKFWKMHDILFKNQKKLKRADLERYARMAGLNMEKFKKSLDQRIHRRTVQADKALAARIGARGTPTFFINGRKISGAQPFEKFKEIIDQEIIRAKRVLKTGISKERLYAELIKDGMIKAPEPEKKPPPPRRREDPNAVYKVELNHSPVKGSRNALVTIVQFTDFQCPFCSRVRDTLEKIKETYKRKVRFVVKHNPLPFHPDAFLAAEASMAAHAQGKFWEYQDLLYQNQRTLKRPDLERYAKKIGLNMAKFRRDLDNHTFKDEIEKDKALARKLGAGGTPNFFINGRKLPGAQPFERFKALIDEELKKAEAMVKKGIKPKEVYAEIMKNASERIKFLEGPTPIRPVATPTYKVEVPRYSPVKGPRRAPVTIIEFSDFQCPFCARVIPTLDRIIKEYKNKVRLVFRHYPLPFHHDAFLAAEASMEAHAQGKFWQYHDLLFENQRALKREDLERYARKIGLNMTRFKRALDNHVHKSKIDQDIKAGNATGRMGTPSFFINGKKLSGAQPFERFKEMIDQALQKK